MKKGISMAEKAERRRSVIAVVVIGALALTTALMTALFVTARAKKAQAEGRYRTLAESTYRKSYYSLLYNIDGLETATNKLTVASGKATRQEYLSDITAYSTAAAENMAAFTPEEAGDSKMLKFINQTGDFAKYLDDKLNKGGELSATDRRTIGEIAAAVGEIKGTLTALGDEAERGDFSFVDTLRDRNSLFSETLRSFEDKDVDYPSMIYDGPFSDSLTERTAKALSGERIGEEEAREIAARIIGVDSADISVKEGSKNVFESYACEAETPRGRAYLTLAKQGGFPVSLNLPEEREGGVSLAATDVERMAEDFLRELGIPSMKAVWASLYEDVYYINLAAEERGVILYPDLIKVKVSASGGKILGMESLNYLYNHMTRDLPTAVVTAQEAAEAISEYIAVTSCRLTLVPTKGGGEALAYEFFGTKGEDKYFVYVDAESGEEMKIMRVLDGERGLLLQ